MNKFDHSIFSDEDDEDFMGRFNSIDPEDTLALGQFVIDEIDVWLQSDGSKTDAAIESAKELGAAAIAMRDGADVTPATMFLMGAVFNRWAVQAIGLERVAGIGRKVDKPQSPIPDEVKRLIASGLNDREIAAKLRYSKSTVNRYRQKLKDK